MYTKYCLSKQNVVEKSANLFWFIMFLKSFKKSVKVLIYFKYENNGDWDQVKTHNTHWNVIAFCQWNHASLKYEARVLHHFLQIATTSGVLYPWHNTGYPSIHSGISFHSTTISPWNNAYQCILSVIIDYHWT